MQGFTEKALLSVRRRFFSNFSLHTVTLYQVEHSVSGVLGLSVQHSARVGVTVTTDTATLATFTGVVYQVSSVLLNVCDYQRVYASYKVITDNTDNMLWQDSASHHHLNLSVVRGRGVVTGQVCICICIYFCLYLQGESKKSGISKSMYIALRAIKIKQIKF